VLEPPLVTVDLDLRRLAPPHARGGGQPGQLPGMGVGVWERCHTLLRMMRVWVRRRFVS